MTKRAVIYCRVSTKEQKDSGTSLDKQEEACRKYAKAHGFEIVGTFKMTIPGLCRSNKGRRVAKRTRC